MSDIDHALQALGFSVDESGALVAPKDSRATLTPIGTFFELRISMGDGNAALCIVSKSAIKVTREVTPPEAVDAETLIVGPPRRRPW